MKRTTLAGVAGLVLSGLAVLPASAAPTWVDTDDLVDTGDQVTQLQVDTFVDPSTHAQGTVLTWVDAATDDVVLAYRRPGAAWSAPITLADPTGAPRLEQLAGLTVSYSVGSTLSTVGLRPSDLGATLPTVVADHVVPGTVTTAGEHLVWAEDLGDGKQRLVARNGSSLVEVAPAAEVTFVETAGGLAPFDFPYVVWVSQAPDRSQQLLLNMVGNRSPQALGRTGSTYADLAFSASGEIAWVEKAGSAAAEVRTALLDRLGSWQVFGVPASAGNAAEPSLAKFLGPGDHVLVWREQDDSTWSVKSSALGVSTAGAWSAPVTLDSGAGVLGADQFAASAGPGGQAVSWCRPDAAGCTVRAAFRSGTTWGPTATLGTVATAADARLATPSPAAVGSQDGVAPTAWTDGGDDVRVSANDHVGPMTTPRNVSRANLDNRLIARWSGRDDWSGVASYRLQVADFGPRQGNGDLRWRTAVGATSRTQRALRVAPGSTRCFQARATDGVGNVGDESPVRCTMAPVDDRGLHRSKGWSRVRDAKSYRNTLLRSTRKGATLTFRNYPFTSLMLLVRQVPRGGKVEVLLGGRRIRTLSTAGPAKRMVPLPADRDSLRSQKRTLQLRVVSSGRPVLIDGVFLGQFLPNPREARDPS
ncbi:hypothetical protein GCM10023350_21040 [Nocardioides endophyticus]|uniref:Fibronectin type-III domain-containing protein n=1 Tax=Nocardioides endophyticus TaxID=1353775 RepID=A0ABP8YQH6_9ACTN